MLIFALAISSLGMAPPAQGQCWGQTENLVAWGGDSQPEVANPVSISGGVAIVGARLDDDNGTDSGAAYVFRLDGSQWILEQKLFALDGCPGDEFGVAVSTSGNVAIVGAYRDSDLGYLSGSAYVFRFDGSQWIEEEKLLASDGEEFAIFGISVSINGDVAIVGALGDDVNHSFDNAGSAYVFRFDGSQWVQGQKLFAADAGMSDGFGVSVSIDGDEAIVGAINANAVYVFRFDGSQWVQEQKLSASDGAYGFGLSGSISGEVAIIGTYSGAAYVFRFDGSKWGQEQKLVASGDYFGVSVSIGENVAIVGAPLDDDNGTDSGSAYVFRFDGSQWAQEQKLLALDGAPGDRFGVSVAISGDSTIIRAAPANSAYIFEFGWEANLQVVIRRHDSGLDAATSLPVSDENLGGAESFVVELWASDTGPAQTGLVSVYVDLAFSPSIVEAMSIEHRPPFNLFEEGIIDNASGTIVNLGGTDGTFSCVGIEREWVRVAVVHFDVLQPCNLAAIVLSASPLEVSGCGAGAIDTVCTNFGVRSVDVGFGCPYDLDGSGFINAGDLGLFAPCWMAAQGDPGYDPACDFDCSGVVAGGDLGWFAAAWLRSCGELSEPQVPPCRRCTAPEGDGAPANVWIGWRIRSVSGNEPRSGRWLSISGQRLLLELFVRDDSAGSGGLTTVFVDLSIDPREVAAAHVDVDDVFGLFASGMAEPGRIERLGGATLAPSIAAAQWVRFAAVDLVAQADLLHRPAVVIKPSPGGVAALGRGSIPDQRIHVIPLR